MHVPRTDDDQSKAILEAASRILSAEGADALTVRRIAAEAGCSTMGLYSRFGGKEGVIDELYVEGFRQLSDGMSVMPKTGDPVVDLRSCARAYRQTALTNATHYMVMFGGAVPGFVPTKPSRAVAHGAFERLTASVQRCIDAGSFKGDAAEIAEVWWGAMHGLVMLELLGIDPVKGDPSRRFDRLLDTLLDGLRFEGLSRVTLEPVPRASSNDAPRGVSGQLTERARRLIDHALDRVFDEPYEIHSEDDFERVMSEHRATMSFMSAGALAGFVERALPLAKLSTKAGKKVPLPAIKYTIAAIPIAMQLGNSVRHGIREVQVLASYLIHRLRQAGVEPKRGLVTALALSISLDPERRPDLSLTPARAGAGLARLWIMRSMRKESGKSVGRRARSEAAAVDRLDFRAVSKDWEARLA